MDIQIPEGVDVKRVIVVGVLTAAAIGLIMALAELMTEQNAIHDHIRRVELSADQITSLIAEATTIARKAAEG